MTFQSRRGACRWLSATAFAVAAAFAVPASAQHRGHGSAKGSAPAAQVSNSVKAGDLTIAAAYTRQPPDGARVAGGFLKITNSGKESDRLVGGSTPFAKSLEVHEMAVVDGVMKMRELAKGIEIKPGETVELKPGGLHVMFMNITQRPKTGETVKVTLKFEKAGEVTIDMSVVAAGQTAPGAKMHH